MAITRSRPPSAQPLTSEPSRGRRRRWPRRLLIALNIFVAMCIVATASTYGYFRWKFGQIPKISDLAGVLRGEEAPGDPMNVLFVGSDSRANISDEERRSFGSSRTVGGQRADSIIVVHVDPGAERAKMISIPRDLWVPIAGTNRSDRINAAFQEGPKQLIATIDQSLGIPIDHYVQMDFNGFRGLVDAVGGVEMYIPSRVRDQMSGLDIREPGCVTLDGNMALAWVRSRNFQYVENGKWRTDPRGDIGRIERQQDFVRRLVREAGEKAKGLNVNAINDLVNTGIQNVQIDDTFTSSDIARLAQRFRSLSPDAVEMLTLPTVNANIGGASVLRLKQPEAQQVIDSFNEVQPEEPGEAPPSDVLPSSVGIRVLNGSGAPGQASEAAEAFRRAGFNIRGVGDADSFRYESTVIRYGRGQRDKAELVASRVKGNSTVREDLTLRGVDLVVVTGAAFGGVVGGEAEPAAPAASAPKQPAPPQEAPAKTEPPPPPEPEC